MNIAVFGNTSKEGVLATVFRLFEELKNREVVVLLHEELFNFLKKEGVAFTENMQKLSSVEMLSETDIAISIGGDGTFLNTVLRLGKTQIPMLGINLGRLGFLADVTVEEIPQIVEELFSGSYRVEERSLLETTLSGGDMNIYPYALNEIAVLKQDSSSMLTINADINNTFLANYQADGLIVATPTGSTAYSMSVGGPIMVPEANSLILAPIAPHSLNVRPLVIKDDWEIELKVETRSNCYLISIDGRSEILSNKITLKIKKADFVVKVIKFGGHTFFDTLRSKLMWGIDRR